MINRSIYENGCVKKIIAEGTAIQDLEHLVFGLQNWYDYERTETYFKSVLVGDRVFLKVIALVVAET